jgi:hypothetical protein
MTNAIASRASSFFDGLSMSNTRLDLYKEAMDLERKRTALQADIDQITLRLSQLHSQLSSAFSVSTPAEATATSIASRKRRRAGRGELKSQILEALATAGSAGLRVRNLVNQLGTKPANIYAWFQNATKTNRQIKKIGSAHYRLEGSRPELKTPAPASKKSPGKRNTRPKGKRGQLAASIIEALKTAGKAGMKLRDLAEKLGTKYGNLSVWFATTGKKNKAIKKIGEAHYRLG